jgi:hypothetical protein
VIEVLCENICKQRYKIFFSVNSGRFDKFYCTGGDIGMGIVSEIFFWITVTCFIDSDCNFDSLFFVFPQTKQDVGGCGVTD